MLKYTVYRQRWKGYYNSITKKYGVENCDEKRRRNRKIGTIIVKSICPNQIIMLWTPFIFLFFFFICIETNKQIDKSLKSFNCLSEVWFFSMCRFEFIENLYVLLSVCQLFVNEYFFKMILSFNVSFNHFSTIFEKIFLRLSEIYIPTL